MTEESKELRQMLLTTMVTNENMKWSFLSGGRPRVNGDFWEPQYGLLDSITWLLLAWVIIVLILVYWRQSSHQKPRTKNHVKVQFVTEQKEDWHHEYHNEEEEEAESVSDDGDDRWEEEAPSLALSPIPSNTMTMTMEESSSTVEELPEIMEENEDEDHDDIVSPSKRHSLRLALKKHQGLGSGWESPGERYSLRVASHLE